MGMERQASRKDRTMSIKSVIKSELRSQLESLNRAESWGKKCSKCQSLWLSPSGVIAGENQGIVRVREGFPGVKQAGRDEEMIAYKHFRSWSPGEEGSLVGLHLKQTIPSSKNSKKAEWSSWVLAADKPYHLLFIPHRYLVGILCEENETNTREPVYPFKLQALFFFFYRPPMSSWIVFKLFVHACEFCRAVSSSHNKHLDFSHLFLTPDEWAVSREQSWKRFRICLAICPVRGKGHSENMF